VTEKEFAELAIIYSQLNKAVSIEKVKEILSKLKTLMAKVSPKLISPFAEYSFTPNKP
jgi:hypothetical protein